MTRRRLGSTVRKWRTQTLTYLSFPITLQPHRDHSADSASFPAQAPPIRAVLPSREKSREIQCRSREDFRKRCKWMERG
jgi:hypothetical protein